MSNIDTTARKYITQSILLTLGVSALIYIISYMLGKHDMMVMPITVSSLFSIILSVSIGLIWRFVAKNTPETLTTFYTATSGFRMLSALIVLAVVYAVVGRDMMLPYVVAFIVFYFVMIAHHSLYFARITNKK
ncbi:MAG: hypothetical protein PUH87_06750 [Bacteroidales bacterium]|nr:hypothetical protein [Bacteroidales bacterium]MDY5448153.1 hypothetical protein [Prevotella sp.]